MTGDEEVAKVNGLEGNEGPGTVKEEGTGQVPEPAPITIQVPVEGVMPPSSGSDVEAEQVNSSGEVPSPSPEENNEKEPPLVILPAIHDYDSDIEEPSSELGLPTRSAIIEQLIQKHRSMVETFSKEKEGLEAPDQLPEGESEEEKARRDEINRVVQTLKSERGSLRERNKLLSKELFELLERQERLKDRSQEISSLQRYISDLEWKIETEDIKIEQERRHLDEIKATMRTLRAITEGLTPDELTDRTVQVQEEIDQNLLRMEEAHNAMLEKVAQSNLHHGKYLDAQKRAREIEARRQWLTRRVELHSEMGKFWEGQLENQRKLDTEESLRPIGTIRDALLARMEERPAGRQEEGAKVQERERPKGPSDVKGPAEPQVQGPQGRKPRGRPRKKVGPLQPEVRDGSDANVQGPEGKVAAPAPADTAASDEAKATETEQDHGAASAQEGGGA